MTAHPGNLAGKPPLGQKAPKQARGTKAARDHMARVAALPCVCCGFHPVEVHHCISDRFGQRKASDIETIPLCYEHHRGASGIHASKSAWEAVYGKDYDYLPMVADQLAGQFNSPWPKQVGPDYLDMVKDPVSGQWNSPWGMK